MKLLIEVFLDGYNTPQKQEIAIIEVGEEQLDMTASSINILWAEKLTKE